MSLLEFVERYVANPHILSGGVSGTLLIVSPVILLLLIFGIGMVLQFKLGDGSLSEHRTEYRLMAFAASYIPMCYFSHLLGLILSVCLLLYVLFAERSEWKALRDRNEGEFSGRRGRIGQSMLVCWVIGFVLWIIVTCLPF